MSRAPTFRMVDAALRERGGVSPLADDAVRESLARHTREGGATPWFVSLLSGVGAWLAALFFFAFLGCAGVLDSEWFLMFIGVGGFVLGLVLRRFRPLQKMEAGVFVEQVGLAAVMLGPAAIVAAVSELTHTPWIAALSLLLVSLVALASVPDALVAFLFTLAVVGSGSFLAFDTNVSWWDEATTVVVVLLVHALLARGERRLPVPLGKLFGPVTAGLFLSALGLLVFRVVSNRIGTTGPTWLAGTLDIVLLVVLTAVSICSALHAVHETKPSRKAEVMALTGAFFVVLAALTYRMPELVCTTGFVVVAFHRGRPMLVWVAGVMTVCAGGLYYYDLSLTLLEKSIAMFAGGVVFLATRKLVAWRFGAKAAPVAPVSEVTT